MEGVVVAELEEALDAGRRVLRTLAVVAVRERHDETRTLQPLALAGGDELVDHDLGAVGKVADWRGRDDQPVFATRVEESQSEGLAQRLPDGSVNVQQWSEPFLVRASFQTARCKVTELQAGRQLGCERVR